MPGRQRTGSACVAAFAAAALFFGAGLGLVPGSPQKTAPQANFSVLATVVRYIKNDYLEEPDPKKTMEGAFQGLVNSLDVLSGYLDKADAAKAANPHNLLLKDVGVILFKRYGAFPIVIGIVANSPAEKAGIQIGDYLSAVDDRSILVWSLSEINLSLKDMNPAPVKLRIIRGGSTKVIQTDRANIYPRPLTMSAQSGTAGVLKIHHFYPPLVSEFKKSILLQVRAQKIPLVLDLRNCHEGELAEARSFLNLFLKAERAGYFVKKAGAKEDVTLPGEALLEKLPLIVWVNQATMGPAEIVSAVLQDFKKAKVVGIETPGLTAKQDLFPLESGDALLLSTAVFCLNSGKSVWNKGVSPDVKLDLDKTETKFYLEKTLALVSGR
jgi:carboxyl-terminal processing protease